MVKNSHNKFFVKHIYHFICNILLSPLTQRLNEVFLEVIKAVVQKKFQAQGFKSI